MAAEAKKDELILVMLSQLALMYWRPDFHPGQAKQLMAMYLEDLRPYATTAIKDAIQQYRRDPENKFFPTSGQLLAYITTKPSWDVVSDSRHRGNMLRAGEAEMVRMEEQQFLAITDKRQAAE